MLLLELCFSLFIWVSYTQFYTLKKFFLVLYFWGCFFNHWFQDYLPNTIWLSQDIFLPTIVRLFNYIKIIRIMHFPCEFSLYKLWLKAGFVSYFSLKAEKFQVKTSFLVFISVLSFFMSENLGLFEIYFLLKAIWILFLLLAAKINPILFILINTFL